MNLRLMPLLFFLLSPAFAVTTKTQLDTSLTTLSSDTKKLTAEIPLVEQIATEANQAQSALLIGGIVTAKAGTTISVPFSIIPGTYSVSALQADLVLPTGLTFVSATAGAASTAAGKQLSSSAVGALERILIFGINQTVIGAGVVAMINISIPSTTAKGLYPICFNNPVVSNPAGSALPVSIMSMTVIVS